MAKLIIAPVARQDLSDIFDYIARDKPIAAANWVETIEQKCKLIAMTPEFGDRRPEYGNHNRQIAYLKQNPMTKNVNDRNKPAIGEAACGSAFSDDFQSVVSLSTREAATQELSHGRGHAWADATVSNAGFVL